MRRIAVVGLLAVASVAAAGCAGAPAKGRQAVSRSELAEHTGTFVVLDKKLVKKIAVVEEQTTKTQDGRLQVYKTFLNKDKAVARLQIQTVFKDANNVVTGDETNWELILIPGNAYYYYQAKAMNDKAQMHVTRVRIAI